MKNRNFFRHFFATSSATVSSSRNFIHSWNRHHNFGNSFWSFIRDREMYAIVEHASNVVQCRFLFFLTFLFIHLYSSDWGRVLLVACLQISKRSFINDVRTEGNRGVPKSMLLRINVIIKRTKRWTSFFGRLRVYNRFVSHNIKQSMSKCYMVVAVVNQ